MILEALRKKVFNKNEKLAGKWIRELLYVVWSLRTQPSRALHGNTPFFMVYGSEAVLPADLKFRASILRSRRPRPPPNSNGGGTAQNVTTMGRTIHSSRSHSA
jgi:hypothetical protein